MSSISSLTQRKYFVFFCIILFQVKPMHCILFAFQYNEALLFNLQHPPPHIHFTQVRGTTRSRDS